MKVILGTAHSKNTPGKQSPDGRLLEYAYSREICKKIKDVLTLKGVDCMIDIEGDYEGSLQNRCNIVNKVCEQNGPSNCLYVSVHVNAASNGKWSNARGFCVFVCPTASQKSRKLAQYIYKEAMDRNLKGNRYTPATKYLTANYYVLKYTKCPAVLTENLFQDNKEDVDFLLSEKGKQAIVDLHVEGILNYIKEFK